MPLTLVGLRRHAVSRSLFPSTTLMSAVRTLGFVQADPIRAPARAQDLILRHRVRGYRAGDLERRYPRLPVAEDSFVNYGFLPREVQALMHPRRARHAWDARSRRRAVALLAFVRERGTVHPREVDAYFAHGRVTNYWGGASTATTHLLDAMQYRGLLRVVRRVGGVRLYAVQDPFAPPGGRAERRARVDALVDLVVRTYAPLPEPSLRSLVSRLRYAVPQWTGELPSAWRRAQRRLGCGQVDGLSWYWPEGERPEDARDGIEDEVRLLAPFDPLVWDRRRFELFWGWPYRFEAYTPVPKRKLGYYALPVLWGDAVVGWANVSVKEGRTVASVGYVAGQAPGERGFRNALDVELARLDTFL
jgi:uncharacterized protein YcaQ